MAHSRLVIRDRITAIIGALLLLALVGASYYYSIQIRLEGLKYVPSRESPDFTARNITLTDFDKTGTAASRLVAQTFDHFSDERVRATGAAYYSLSPDKPQLSLVGDKAWSNDGLETVELSGNVVIRRDAAADEPDLYFKTEYLKGFLDTYHFETDHPVFMRRGIDTTASQGGMTYDDIAHVVELRDRIVSVFHPNAKSSENSVSPENK